MLTVIDKEFKYSSRGKIRMWSSISRLTATRLPSRLVREKSSLSQRALEALRGNVKVDEANKPEKPKKLFDQNPKKVAKKVEKASSPVNDTKLSDVPLPEIPEVRETGLD